jgi:Myb-like DNA-binding domain
LTKSKCEKLMNSPNKRSDLWVKMAECLPNRTVNSIVQFIKRSFNSLNYKGAWTQEEERQLIKKVEEEGSHWVKIAPSFNRTAANVKDKYMSLGGGNAEKRLEVSWSYEETVGLIELVGKELGVKIFDKSPPGHFSAGEPSKQRAKRNLKSRLDPILVAAFHLPQDWCWLV